MLIRFNEIVGKYGIPSGIIHIGAHLMEERSDYLSNGVDRIIWVEANPSIYPKIESVNENKNERVFNFAISDTDDKLIKLNITNNGQSSSILDLEKHKIHHPSIFVTESVEVRSKRMDTLISENNINILDFDFINLGGIL